jgi:hypothetical protein
MDDPKTIAELRADLARCHAFILALSEKLYIVACHLGRLAERQEKRREGR